MPKLVWGLPVAEPFVAMSRDLGRELRVYGVAWASWGLCVLVWRRKA